MKEWPEVCAGDEVMVTGLLGRPLHRWHVFSIKAKSDQLRELELQVK